jgi:hypothetical protein
MATRKIDISKVGGKVEGIWTVIRDDPRTRFGRTNQVEWTLHPDPDEKDPDRQVSAHFQFAHPDLVEDVQGGKKLTPDWTAHIEAGQKLTLKIKLPALFRQNVRDERFGPRYYAVWVRDPNLPFGGAYAVGESKNPPPEIDLGP